MESQALHALGKAGASDEYATVVTTGNPHGAVNVARMHVEVAYAESGAVFPPQSEVLRKLWDGDVRGAYSLADTNLAIVLESAFSDAELGLDVSPTNTYGYKAI